MQHFESLDHEETKEQTSSDITENFSFVTSSLTEEDFTVHATKNQPVNDSNDIMTRNISTEVKDISHENIPALLSLNNANETLHLPLQQLLQSAQSHLPNNNAVNPSLCLFYLYKAALYQQRFSEMKELLQRGIASPRE